MSHLTDFLKQRHDETRDKFMVHVSDDVKAIVKRGTLTFEEYEKMRTNSYERKLLVPLFSDVDFLKYLEHFLSIGDLRESSEFELSSTYKEAVCEQLIFQTIRRYKKIQEERQEMLDLLKDILKSDDEGWADIKRHGFPDELGDRRLTEKIRAMVMKYENGEPEKKETQSNLPDSMPCVVCGGMCGLGDGFCSSTCYDEYNANRPRPVPALQFQIGDRVVVDLDHWQIELRGRHGVVLAICSVEGGLAAEVLIDSQILKTVIRFNFLRKEVKDV